MASVRVLIRNKPGVFDPEGEAIRGAIDRLGYQNVGEVRVGKVVDIDVDETALEGGDDALRAQIEEICAEFLVNPVIERYTIEILEADPGEE